MILIAPDSFKGSAHAATVAQAIATGLRDAADPPPELDLAPLSDGGEGFLDVLSNALAGNPIAATVHDPSGRPITAAWARTPGGDTAIVEFARAAGLPLVPPAERNPRRLTSQGVGELIRAAIDAGARTILVGLGGSATVDGGLGLLQGLGATFRDASGHPLHDPITPTVADDIADFQPPELPDDLTLRIACDVNNPLLGPLGAATVFGPQKGASPEDVRFLEGTLRRLTTILGDPGEQPGDGAAGGAGYALRVGAGAQLERGADLVLDAIDFDTRVARARLLITGEGRLDSQSLMGKACTAAALRAARHGVPTWLIAGDIAPGVREDPRFDLFVHMISLAETCGVEPALADPAAAIRAATARLAGGTA